MASNYSVAVIVWEWNAGDGRWNPYMPDISNYIETNYHQRQSPIYLKDVDLNLRQFTLHLTTNTAYNANTGIVSNIRRQQYSEISLPGAGVMWQWIGDNGIDWHCYSIEVANVLEHALHNNVSTVDLDRPPLHLPYVVRLTSMEQTRNGSGFTRKIRRLDLGSSYGSYARSPDVTAANNSVVHNQSGFQFSPLSSSSAVNNMTYDFNPTDRLSGAPVSAAIAGHANSVAAFGGFRGGGSTTGNTFGFTSNSDSAQQNSNVFSMGSNSRSNTAHGSVNAASGKKRERKLKQHQNQQSVPATGQHQAASVPPQMPVFQPAPPTSPSLMSWRQSNDQPFAQRSAGGLQMNNSLSPATPSGFQTPSSAHSNNFLSWRQTSESDHDAIDVDHPSNVSVVPPSASSTTGWFSRGFDYSRQFLTGTFQSVANVFQKNVKTLSDTYQNVKSSLFDSLGDLFGQMSMGKRKRDDYANGNSSFGSSQNASNSLQDNPFFLKSSGIPRAATRQSRKMFIRDDGATASFSSQSSLNDNNSGMFDNGDPASFSSQSSFNGNNSGMASGGAITRTSTRSSRYVLKTNDTSAGDPQSAMSQTKRSLPDDDDAEMDSQNSLPWPAASSGAFSQQVSSPFASRGLVSYSGMPQTPSQSNQDMSRDDGRRPEVRSKRLKTEEGSVEFVPQNALGAGCSTEVSAAAILRDYAKRVKEPPENEDCCICQESLAKPSGYGEDDRDGKKDGQDDHDGKDDHDGQADHDVGELSKCGHKFHCLCICAMYENGSKNGSLQCPSCKLIYGMKQGDCPDGTMSYVGLAQDLDGYPGCGSIRITYHIPKGERDGQKYRPHGFPRYGYLPNNKEGNQVLDLLKEAWRRRLTFTIGTSVTTGEQNCVVWNEIHHKTSPAPNHPHGYPDPNYLDNVIAEMAAQGVTDVEIG